MPRLALEDRLDPDEPAVLEWDHLHELRRVPDGRERVPELVSEHGQEIVLEPGLLLQRLVRALLVGHVERGAAHAALAPEDERKPHAEEVAILSAFRSVGLENLLRLVVAEHEEVILPELTRRPVGQKIEVG